MRWIWCLCGGATTGFGLIGWLMWGHSRLERTGIKESAWYIVWQGFSGYGGVVHIGLTIALLLFVVWPLVRWIKSRPREEDTGSWDEPQQLVARYRIALEETREGVAVVHRESLRIIFANPALARILGLITEVELDGTCLLDFLPESEHQRLKESFQESCSRHKSRRRIYTARTKTGEPIWLEIFICRESLDGDPYRLLLVSDVTNCKRTQEHSQYQARLLRDVDDAILATDMDFHILSWNQAAERMYGWTEQEVLGREVKDIIPIKIEGLSRDELRQVVINQGKWRGQALHYSRDGRELNIDWSISTLRDSAGEAVGVVAINRDMTEHRRMERALNEAHERLLTILDGLDAAVCVVDMKTHEILFASRYVREFFGAEMVGLTCWQMLRREPCEPKDFCTNRLLTDDIGEPTGTQRFERQDNLRNDWWDVQARMIRWADGRKVRLEIATNITQRKTMEMELHAREQLYHSVFENTGTATIIIEEDMTISAANAECETLSGYPREEVEGKKRWTEFVLAEDLERMVQFHGQRRMRDGDVPPEYSFRMRTKRGEMKEILIKICLIPGTSRSIASMIDITAHKQSAERLRASEQRLREQNRVLVELARSKPVASGDLNEALGQIVQAAAHTLAVHRVSLWLYTYDRTVIRCLLWYSTHTGIRPTDRQLAVRDFPNYFAALEQDRVLAADNALDDPRTAEFAESYLKPLGITSMLDAPVWVDGEIKGVLCQEHTGEPRQWGHEEQQFAGSMADFVALTLEAYERRRAEQALRKSEERHRELADLLPQPVFEITVDGKISFANRSALNSLGYSEDELARGIHVLQVVAPKHRDRAEQAMEQASGVKELHPELELDLVRKNGSTFPVVVYVNPIVQEGKSVGFRGILMDTSERKKMESELLTIQRLESIAVLAGGIAHDFNNLLMVIMGNIAMAQMFTRPEDSAHRLLGEAEKASLRAKDLAYKLLTFSKGGEPIKRATTLPGLIQDVVTVTLSGGNVKAHWDIANDLWLVDCDPLQINQVISNLVINAREAMPKGGMIDIRARNVEASQEAVLPFKEGRYVNVIVRDRGVGIAPEHIDRIFDPYFTTKTRGPERGSGLGLSIVYSIVKKHGGFVAVESKVEVGTAFSIYLPVSITRAEPSQRPSCEPNRSLERILVMDDEDIVRDVIGKQLAHLGYQAVLVRDGAEALLAYQEAMEAGQPFAGVIMDLTIPGGMGGRETIPRLIALDPHARAILSSGYSNDPIMQDYGAYGFRGMVAKPYKIHELREVLQVALKEGD